MAGKEYMETEDCKIGRRINEDINPTQVSEWHCRFESLSCLCNTAYKSRFMLAKKLVLELL